MRPEHHFQPALARRSSPHPEPPRTPRLPAVAGRSRASDQGCTPPVPRTSSRGESRACPPWRARRTSRKKAPPVMSPRRDHPGAGGSRPISPARIHSPVPTARPNPSRINTSANSSFFIKSLIINDLKSNRMSERGNKSPRINTSENYRSKSFRINTSRNHRGEVVGPNCKSRSLTNVRQNRATRFGMTIRGGGEW
jgi:hypothetical protein